VSAALEGTVSATTSERTDAATDCPWYFDASILQESAALERTDAAAL
jgi:hypothetical protein